MYLFTLQARNVAKILLSNANNNGFHNTSPPNMQQQSPALVRHKYRCSIAIYRANIYYGLVKVGLLKIFPSSVFPEGIYPYITYSISYMESTAQDRQITGRQ